MWENELNLAKKAAVEAGNILKSKTAMKVDGEIGKDIKLSSDKLSEKRIIEILRGTDYPILSEEYGKIEGNKTEYQWIIDPLDGTANYLRNLNELVCVSIALWQKGKPVLGVVNRFFCDELYYGVVGEDAWLNEEKIMTSGITEVGKAFLATGFPVFRDYSSESLLKFIQNIQNFKKIRMLGSAAMMGTFVAAGEIDVYIEEEIMLWDIAASAALVLAAGGAAEITMLEDNKCICKLFANEELKGSLC